MNAVIYARYSSHSQNEQSIEGQLKDDYAYADQLGIKVVGEYIDKAQSGRTDARTDFQRLMEDAPKGHFKMVIVWKLDRFARNRYDSAIYKAKLKKYGIRVVSVKENITDSPEGIILEGLLESMAEYYSANLAQNIRRGHRVLEYALIRRARSGQAAAHQARQQDTRQAVIKQQRFLYRLPEGFNIHEL
jgi:DNA invertase Pin-like site-specific DNA recombinase